MEDKLLKRVEDAIRDVNDFPKKGIVFKDITPIFSDPNLCKDITSYLKSQLKNHLPDVIVGVESRGFFWGLLLAQELGIPFIPVRKKGKLPYKTVSYKYALEYGEAEIEMHKEVLEKNQNVLIHDDLLATGGTAVAAAELVELQGAKVIGFSFLVILNFLNGEEKLSKYSTNINTIVRY